jgi:hypothetical protein
MHSRKDLFDFMIKQVRQAGAQSALREPQAFGRWFAQMYFQRVTDVQTSDGSGDGKVDLLVTTQAGKSVRHKILNTKFTLEYDRASPVSFYDEITRYWQAFENKSNRPEYLKTVRPTLHSHFRRLFKLYDDGDAELFFVTNHRVNDKQAAAVKRYKIKVLHLDDVLQYVAENIEGAMPETEPLLLTDISNVLTPPTNESEVPTSIVFARLHDFIEYMLDEPFDLLFARNVRLWLGSTETNKSIRETFEDSPKEFAYSNNGITILCNGHTHDPGKQELRIFNPRVVNGSQTLHSIRDVANPSRVARAMVRIIEVPALKSNDISARAEQRKEIIHKISIRSNQQNPIKRWNLVANDDYQNELAQFFWSKKVYYERRHREWQQRKVQLSSIGLRKGPDIRWLTQLIAAKHWNRARLGPAVAQGQLNSLFEEDPYKVIRGTKPEEAYQLYLVGEIIDRVLRRLSSKAYIDRIRGYVALSLYSAVIKVSRDAGIAFGSGQMEAHLAPMAKAPERIWDLIVKALVDHILSDYKVAAARSYKKDGAELSHPTYFKNNTLVSSMLARPIPADTRRQLLATLKW